VVLCLRSTRETNAAVTGWERRSRGLITSALLFGILGNVDVESLRIHHFVSITHLFREHVRSHREGEVSELLTLQQAADLADVKVAQIRARIAIGELTPKRLGTSVTTGETTYLFSEADVVRLKTMTFAPRQKSSDEPFVDDGKQTDFTVAQIASMWQLSTDTIQRLFQDEPGVVALGNKNPRGKRKRVTLRIPRSVMERVKKFRSNPK
jgi:hypothetical protein